MKILTKPGCKHSLGPGSTLLITHDVRRLYFSWSACCTKCRQWTGYLETREEAISRATKGLWCK